MPVSPLALLVRFGQRVIGVQLPFDAAPWRGPRPSAKALKEAIKSREVSPLAAAYLLLLAIAGPLITRFGGPRPPTRSPLREQDARAE